MLCINCRHWNSGAAQFVCSAAQRRVFCMNGGEGIMFQRIMYLSSTSCFASDAASVADDALSSSHCDTTLTRAIAACSATDGGIDVMAVAAATCRCADVAANESY